MFSKFANTTVRTVIGRFNVHTTERHQFIKTIMSNSDNCKNTISDAMLADKFLDSIVKNDSKVALKLLK